MVGFYPRVLLICDAVMQILGAVPLIRDGSSETYVTPGNLWFALQFIYVAFGRFFGEEPTGFDKPWPKIDKLFHNRVILPIDLEYLDIHVGYVWLQTSHIFLGQIANIRTW